MAATQINDFSTVEMSINLDGNLIAYPRIVTDCTGNQLLRRIQFIVIQYRACGQFMNVDSGIGMSIERDMRRF